MMAALRLAALTTFGSLILAQEGLFGAMDILHDGISPRYYNNAPQLAKRDGPPCNAGFHRCIDVGAEDQCCSNNQYCYINPQGNPRCCAIGSNCDSRCEATAYQCEVAVTTAASASASASASAACCQRRCQSTSMFQCEAEFGGNCCGYGSTCASGGLCRSTRITTSAVVTAIDPGCTSTDQHACPDNQGCCLNWMHCTTVSGEPACAPGNTANGYSFAPEPTTGQDGGGGSGGGLSTGAKAGIGVGIALVVCAIIGAFAWICLLRRRRERQPSEQSSSHQQEQQEPQVPMGSDHSPRAMSEVTSDVTRASRLRGLTQDYFGPNAVAGPYTDTEPVTTSPATSPGFTDRGVPVQAHSPSDITAPVEIDSRVTQGLKDDVTVASRPVPPPTAPDTTDGRFELDGSGVIGQLDSTPSPAADSPTYQDPALGRVHYRGFQ